jgi:hypothetical protein
MLMHNMKMLLSAVAVLGVGLTGAASADTLDPLHFTCSNCGPDANGMTPTLGGNPTGIVVDESGTPQQLVANDFLLKVLIPVLTPPTTDTVGVTGRLGGNSAFTGTASLFTSTTQGTEWTSGSLEGNFLGIAFQPPPNPIGAFLPLTQVVDPGATGYAVLTLDLGPLTIFANDNGGFGASPFSLAFLANLPAGSWILGDAIVNGVDTTTAQSAGVFVEPLAATPLPAALPMFLGGLAGFWGLVRRRKVKASNQLA